VAVKAILKVLLGLVVVVVALGLVMTLIGMALPRRHHVTSHALIGASPDSVWAAITDWPSSPSWRPEVTRVERLPDRNGHEVWNQTGPDGSWPLEIVQSEPAALLVAAVADSSQGYGGTWTYRLAPEGDGTRVTITEDGFVDNPLFRFMANYVFGLRGTLNGYLEGLGQRFGQTVRAVAG